MPLAFTTTVVLFFVRCFFDFDYCIIKATRKGKKVKMNFDKGKSLLVLDSTFINVFSTVVLYFNSLYQVL